MNERVQTFGNGWSQRLGLVLGPMLFALCLIFPIDTYRTDPGWMAAVAALMAVWWITEAIPLVATSLLPLVLFPLLGIMPATVVAPVYVNSTIFLFVGGFIIALAMEKWGLHRRVALVIVRLVGGGPARMLLGFMLAAALLSMWISNTATAMMMLPIVLAVIQRRAGLAVGRSTAGARVAAQTSGEHGAGETHHFAVALLLGVAYACSIGGMATLIGTPPNLSLARIFAISFPDAPTLTFGQWMLLGLPITVVMLLSTWLLLWRLLLRKMPREGASDRSVIEREYRGLGPISFEEKAVLTVFVGTALLWVFRSDLKLGAFVVPGWNRLLPYPLLDDGSVAIMAAIVLFLLPTRSGDAGAPRLLSGDDILRVRWDIVLLFGGGFALAQGFQTSGLSAVIGAQFSALAAVPPLLIIAAICLVVTFLTELTSNTATTEMLLPIFAALAVAMQVHPLLLMVPATISASCAFMMPVATPPNAIVFGSGHLRIAEMARIGLRLNLIGALVITVLFYLLGGWLLGIDFGHAPVWAK